MDIEGIFFDIDDVLYDSSGFAEKARLAGLEAIHHYFTEFSFSQLKEDMDIVLAERGSNYPHLFDQILKRGSVKESDPRYYLAIADAIKHYHDEKYDPEGFAPFPDVRETLLELCRKDMKLGIISNGNPKKQFDKLIRLGLLDFFRPEHVIISGAVGCEKPEGRIYRIALNRVGVKSAAHCDDRVEYVQGAMEAGMTGIHILKGKHSKHSGSEGVDYRIKNLSEILDIL